MALHCLVHFKHKALIISTYMLGLPNSKRNIRIMGIIDNVFKTLKDIIRFYSSVWNLAWQKLGRGDTYSCRWSASLGSTGFLCAPGEYPMPVADLEFYYSGAICRVTIFLNNTELNIWSSVAEVLQCYCDSTILPIQHHQTGAKVLSAKKPLVLFHLVFTNTNVNPMYLYFESLKTC